jgi:hypothetical protein
MTVDEVYCESDGTAPSYAWPGGYPLYYLCADGGVLCPTCTNKEKHLVTSAEIDGCSPSQWGIIGRDTNWEDPELFCDHCYARIESAYAESDTVNE